MARPYTRRKDPPQRISPKKAPDEGGATQQEHVLMGRDTYQVNAVQNTMNDLMTKKHLFREVGVDLCTPDQDPEDCVLFDNTHYYCIPAHIQFEL